MTAPDRPNREQVDAVPHKAAALLLAAARPDPTLRTAARQVQDALIALDDEVRALRAELDRVCDEAANALVNQTALKGMSVEEGAAILDLAPPRELVVAWVNAARQMLGDAENYSETRIDFPAASMEVAAAGEPERYVFTVQRAGKLTPHEARRAAEAEVRELRAALAARTPQPAEPTPTTADLLRAAAAGRREYAGKGDVPGADELLAEATTLDLAAQVADGDMRPLYGWLPSWRWTAGMEQRVRSSTSEATVREDAAGLSSPLPAVPSGEDREPGLLSVQELTKVLTQACEWEDSEISDPTGVASYLASWLNAADLQVRRASTVINLPFGEDVPARLDGAGLIAAERQRQVVEEGWTPEHDAEHQGEELAIAAACYAIPNSMRRYPNGAPALWPWHPSWWKASPDDRARELVKAGALIAAEIDRAAALARPDEVTSG